MSSAAGGDHNSGCGRAAAAGDRAGRAGARGRGGNAVQLVHGTPQGGCLRLRPPDMQQLLRCASGQLSLLPAANQQPDPAFSHLSSCMLQCEGAAHLRGGISTARLRSMR